MRRIYCLLPVLVLLFASCTAQLPSTSPAPAASPSKSGPIEFIVLQINDVYEIAPLEGGKAGGLARVATVRQELLQENPNVITVLAGDFLSPSFMGTMRYQNEAGESEKIAGLQMVETLNAMGLDYATLGNHEFDLKSLELLEKRFDKSTFKYTVCNAQAVEDGKARPFRQNGTPIPEYLVHELITPSGENLRVGLLGVVLPFTQTDYVAYADVTSSFKATLAKLQAVSDMTIALTHQNMEEDEALAEAVPGVPLFIGGHEHEKLNRYVDGTIIAKADANAKTVYIHRVRYDRECGATTIRSVTRKIDDSIVEEPKTQSVVDKWNGKVYDLMRAMGYDGQQEILTLTEPLVCKESLIRTSQTNYGQLTMDAIAAAVPGADFYALNSGSMRLDDNLFNVVTEYDILRTYPYGGSFVTVQLPGSAVKRLLDIGLNKNYGDGGYLQLKQVNLEDLSINGKAVVDNETYQVVMPEFLAGGNEANLEFLKDYLDASADETLTIGNEIIKNDLRDIV
ncbi:MAG: bifunctional metallophosphatase/5'-nucleotidase, partial [Bacteroidota bacterium]